MVEIFIQAPLELRIIIGGCLISGAWFLYREHRAEKKRELHQKYEVIRPKPKLTIVKK